MDNGNTTKHINFKGSRIWWTNGTEHFGNKKLNF